MSLKGKRLSQYVDYQTGQQTAAPKAAAIEVSREKAAAGHKEEKTEQQAPTIRAVWQLLNIVRNVLCFTGAWLLPGLYMAGLAPQSHYWLYLGILAVVSYGNLNLLMIGKRKFTPWDAFTIFDLKNSVWQYEEQTKRNPPLLRQLILKGSGVFFGRRDGNDVGKGQNIDGHVIVFGGSGSGKSSCIAIPTLNRYQGGVLAIDIKDGGELQRKSSTNAPVCVLRPGAPGSYGYDPFWFLDRKNPDAGIREIAASLIPMNPKNPGDFWTLGEQRYLTGALAYCYDAGMSFAESCRTIYALPSEELLKQIQEGKCTFARAAMSDFYGMAAETLGGIIGGVSNAIEVLASDKDVCEVLTRRPLITPDMLLRGERIFISIPEHKLDVYRMLLQLIINQFLRWFEQLSDSETAPVLFMLDEFARLGRYDRLTNALATLRSKKVTIMLLLQSVSQLDELYGKDNRKVMTDNCGYKVILNATDADSQQYFSKLAGTYLKHRRSYSHGKTSSTSVSEREEPILKPEEFATLKEAVLLTPYGLQRIRKQPYYRVKNGLFGGF